MFAGMTGKTTVHGVTSSGALTTSLDGVPYIEVVFHFARESARDPTARVGEDAVPCSVSFCVPIGHRCDIRGCVTASGGLPRCERRLSSELSDSWEDGYATRK